VGLVRTEAVILRSIDYSESSKILTLLSPAHGRISVIAKGARRPKSAFRAHVEPLSHIVAIYADKESRNVQTLSQCDILDAYGGMKRDLTALAVGSYLAEVSGAIAPDRHASPELYAVLCAGLTLLDHAPEQAPQILLWTLRRVLGAGGLAPAVERCAVCDRIPGGEPRYFNPRAGGVTCRSCHQAGSRPLKAAAYRALCAAGDAEPAARVEIAAVGSALDALLDHVAFHVEHPCKSVAFLQSRLRPAAVSRA